MCCSDDTKAAFAFFSWIVMLMATMFFVIGTFYGIDLARSDLNFSVLNLDIYLFFMVTLVLTFVIILGLSFFGMISECVYGAWHYSFTLPPIAIMVFICCFMVRSKKIVSQYNDIWKDGIEEKHVQIRYHCCGWDNSSDRSIIPCPFGYTSGCKHVYSDYFDTKVWQTTLCFIVGGSLIGFCLLIYLPITCIEENGGIQLFL